MPAEAGSLRAEARGGNLALKCCGSLRKHFAFCFICYWILNASICITITCSGSDLEVKWKRSGNARLLSFVFLIAWEIRLLGKFYK